MIDKARIPDVPFVHKLLAPEARKHELLPRSLAELYENVRDLFIYRECGEVKGACALHISWSDLAEVRSLVVDPSLRGRGIGLRLIERCVDEAREFGIKRVFALTYRPEVFERAGFKIVDKAILPRKVWGDCVRCHKFPECDEQAVLLELE